MESASKSQKYNKQGKKREQTQKIRKKSRREGGSMFFFGKKLRKKKRRGRRPDAGKVTRDPWALRPGLLRAGAGRGRASQRPARVTPGRYGRGFCVPSMDGPVAGAFLLPVRLSPARAFPGKTP